MSTDYWVPYPLVQYEVLAWLQYQVYMIYYRNFFEKYFMSYYNNYNAGVKRRLVII
jgi:hypothetical protein